MKDIEEELHPFSELDQPHFRAFIQVQKDLFRLERSIVQLQNASGDDAQFVVPSNSGCGTGIVRPGDTQFSPNQTTSNEDAIVRSLRTELSRKNDALLTCFNDLVAIGNLLRNEEQKNARLLSEKKVSDKRAREHKLALLSSRSEITEGRAKLSALQSEKKNVDGKLIALRARYDVVRDDLAARDSLLRSCERKSAELVESRSALEKRVHDREKELAEATGEIARLRHQMSTIVREAHGNERQELSGDEKAIGSQREVSKAKNQDIVVDEPGANRKSDPRVAYAITSSKILSELMTRSLSFPVQHKSSLKHLFFNSSRSARRWGEFCHDIAEEGIFDSKDYLALHPDVAAAGIDPVMHFLSNGLTERRAFNRVSKS